MRTLISSLESDSKRSTLESSSTSSSSRIVGCSSLILAKPLCFSRKLTSANRLWQVESCASTRVAVAAYTSMAGGRITQMSYILLGYLTQVIESSKGNFQEPSTRSSLAKPIAPVQTAQDHRRGSHIPW